MIFRGGDSVGTPTLQEMMVQRGLLFIASTGYCSNCFSAVTRDMSCLTEHLFLPSESNCSRDYSCLLLFYWYSKRPKAKTAAEQPKWNETSWLLAVPAISIRTLPFRCLHFKAGTSCNCSLLQKWVDGKVLLGVLWNWKLSWTKQHPLPPHYLWK